MKMIPRLHLFNPLSRPSDPCAFRPSRTATRHAPNSGRVSSNAAGVRVHGTYGHHVSNLICNLSWGLNWRINRRRRGLCRPAPRRSWSSGMNALPPIAAATGGTSMDMQRRLTRRERCAVPPGWVEPPATSSLCPPNRPRPSPRSPTAPAGIARHRLPIVRVESKRRMASASSAPRPVAPAEAGHSRGRAPDRANGRNRTFVRRKNGPRPGSSPTLVRSAARRASPAGRTRRPPSARPSPASARGAFDSIMPAVGAGRLDRQHPGSAGIREQRDHSTRTSSIAG